MKRATATAPRHKLRPTNRGVLASLLALLRQVGGHATTETLIMIPALAVIWGGIFYTHERYGHFQTMSMYTRAHVWEHVYEGCEGSPPGSNTTFRDGADNSDGFIGGTMSLLFQILPGFQISEIEALRSTRVTRPDVLGEGQLGLGHNLVSMCNEVPQADSSFASQAWRMFGIN